MNKKEKQKNRRTLAILFLLYIFFVMLITVLISFGLVSVMLSLGWVPNAPDGNADPRNIMLFMLVTNLAAGLVVTAVTNRIILRYVNRVIDQMNRLASGDFRARLNFGKPFNDLTVFHEVSDSFNRMAEELEGTEMLRSDFINNFSHEFKTPIVSITGFTKLLKRGNLTEEQKNEYLDIIEEESLRLSAMATNVLNMTKIENQAILTNVAEYNLSEQLRSSVLMLEHKWTRKNVEFGIYFEEHMITASEELLRHVWVNLIDNAVKFSPENGLVEIYVKEQDDRLRVSILNQGSEISPEQQKKIFNKFYQADESHASEGNGIGLALVKKAVELHHGEVLVECGGGSTTFTVILPKKN